jgi:hypothetical protein
VWKEVGVILMKDPTEIVRMKHVPKPLAPHCLGAAGEQARGPQYKDDQSGHQVEQAKTLLTTVGRAVLIDLYKKIYAGHQWLTPIILGT